MDRHRLREGDRDVVARAGEGLAREVRCPRVPLERKILIIDAVVHIKIERFGVWA
jgi:hypothetical protein